MESPFLTLPELSKELQLHYMTVVKLCKQRKIPSLKVGGKWRVPKDYFSRMERMEKEGARSK